MRLLVAGHPACLATDGAVHAVLLEGGVDLEVVESDRRPTGCLQGRAPELVLVDELAPARTAQWVLAANRVRVPAMVSVDDRGDPAGRLAGQIVRLAWLGASALVARTPTADRIARDRGARGPSTLVPRPVSVAGAPAPDGRDRPFTVGYVGALAESSGVPSLLAAIDRLPRQTRLLVAGDGPLRAELARHRKVDLRTTVSRDQVPSLCAEMDVLVLTSPRPTGWPDALGPPVAFEAMGVGTPVLAAASGPVPWVVSEGVGGMAYPAGDVAALAWLLSDVLADPDRWRAAGRQGQEHVREHCSAAASAAALMELAEAVLSRAAQYAPSRRRTAGTVRNRMSTSRLSDRSST